MPLRYYRKNVGRDAQILILRAQGHSIKQIASQFGISVARAGQVCKASLRPYRKDVRWYLRDTLEWADASTE